MTKKDNFYFEPLKASLFGVSFPFSQVFYYSWEFQNLALQEHYVAYMTEKTFESSISQFTVFSSFPLILVSDWT